VKPLKCYRFVKSDLTSENGAMSWQIGEWNKVEGALVCCANGLHAAVTPRESLSNVYGQRWFISQASGAIVRHDNELAASEMRIVREIHQIVLQRFAIWCAADCLVLYENKCPQDTRVSDCIQAAEDYLDDRIKVDEVIKKREAAAAAGAAGAGGAASRAAAAAIAAALAAAAPHPAAWAHASAAAAYAASTAAAAYEAAVATADAHASAHNVATTAAAAALADAAAARAHTAAAAGAVAHAAAVAAARGVAPVDSASDAYYSSYAAFSAHPAEASYAAQSRKLSEMTDEHLPDELV
jgi:hypothetical protein